MKSPIALLIFLSILTFMIGLHIFKKQQLESQRVYRIALLTRNATWADQVTEGINSEIAKHPEIKLDIRPFYAPGRDQLALNAITEEAIASKPDIIISIGIIFTQVAVNILKKRCCSTPMVFGGVGDPVEQGLVSSLDNRTEQVTGVLLGREDNRLGVDVLLKAKPTIKNVLIPYFPSSLMGLFEQIGSEIRDYFTERGINAYLVPLEYRCDVLSLVTPLITKVDTLMLLQGDITGDYNDLLTKLCKQNNVTFFANELEAVRKGAALGFGTHSKDIGTMMMQYAYKILSGKATANNLPILTIGGTRILALNKTTAPLQDLQITDSLLTLVDQVYE